MPKSRQYRQDRKFALLDSTRLIDQHVKRSASSYMAARDLLIKEIGLEAAERQLPHLFAARLIVLRARLSTGVGDEL